MASICLRGTLGGRVNLLAQPSEIDSDHAELPCFVLALGAGDDLEAIQ